MRRKQSQENTFQFQEIIVHFRYLSLQRKINSTNKL